MLCYRLHFLWIWLHLFWIGLRLFSVGLHLLSLGHHFCCHLLMAGFHLGQQFIFYIPRFNRSFCNNTNTAANNLSFRYR
jgi:hypothetical protein